MMGKTVLRFLSIICFGIVWWLGLFHFQQDLLAAGNADQPAGMTENSNVILVKFQADVTEAERLSKIEQMGGELLAWLPQLHVGQIRLRQATPTLNSRSLAVQWMDDTQIVFAEPDGAVEAAFIPNDPDTIDQHKVYTPELLKLFASWEYTTGNKDIVIAVVDSGVDQNHPEFAGRLLPGYDFVQNDSDPADENGHGTHVAGVLGAALNNGIGIAGICGNCALLPVRVLNAHNTGSWAGVAQGVTFAVDHGARVIVLSLGSTAFSQTMKDAIDYAQAHGVLVVAAAGNINSRDAFYPAAFANVLGVGATTRQDQKWPFSNYAQNVKIVAPGESIYSTYWNNDHNPHTYQTLSGTSMAAPHVAGLAGLLLSQAPTRTITDITNIITSTAVDLGDPGHDSLFGYGRINPLAALQLGAVHKIESGQLTGTVWYEQNANSHFDPPIEQAAAGVALELDNATGQSMGVAVTSETGNWIISGIPPGIYTLHITSTTSLAVPDIQVALTGTQLITNLNIGLLSPPSANAITGFTMIRGLQSITLTWSVTNPLISAINVQRATAMDGEFTNIATYELSAQAINNEQPLHLVDELPTELSQTILYYRLLLSPGDVVFGPAATPSQPTASYYVLTPIIVNGSSFR